jgi:hypothetical protein
MARGALGVDARIDLDLGALHLGRDVAVEHERKRALGAFHVDDLPVHAGGDAGGDRNRFLADTRHDLIPLAFGEDDRRSSQPGPSIANQNTVQRISPPTLLSRAS